MKKRGWFKPNGEWHELPSPRMDLLTREDGRIERMCRHGVGHPVGHLKKWDTWMGIHGCCGCCTYWGEDGLSG